MNTLKLCSSYSITLNEGLHSFIRNTVIWQSISTMYARSHRLNVRLSAYDINVSPQYLYEFAEECAPKDMNDFKIAHKYTRRTTGLSQFCRRNSCW